MRRLAVWALRVLAVLSLGSFAFLFLTSFGYDVDFAEGWQVDGRYYLGEGGIATEVPYWLYRFVQGYRGFILGALGTGAFSLHVLRTMNDRAFASGVQDVVGGCIASIPAWYILGPPRGTPGRVLGQFAFAAGLAVVAIVFGVWRNRRRRAGLVEGSHGASHG